MNTFDYIKYYTDKSIRDNYQISNATIKRVHTNSTYDIVTIVGSDDTPLFNISPVDPKIIFSVEDSVTVLIPVGNTQLTRILGYSNIQFPAEEIVEFNEPVGGTIYLACPGENAVKIYSLLGEENVAISIPERYPTDICTVGAYIYASCDYGFYMYKFKPDGSEFSVIVESGGSEWYRYGDVGLAVDSTYLYCLFNYGIARINILNGDIEPGWKGFNWLDSNTEFEDALNATDLCGNSNYLFVVGNAYTGGGRAVIRVFDYSGNFIREIFIYSANIYKITADETNIYLYSVADEYFIDTTVEIYTITGTFIRSISENGIRAVAVKDGKIYIVTEENSEGGAT